MDDLTNNNLPPMIPSTEDSVPPPPPPAIEPAVVVSDNAQVVKPKKKWGTGVLIGSVIVVILLVGGLLAGVKLTKERQRATIKAGLNGCMDCVNCPDDHLKSYCANIPGGHHPDAPPKQGETQTTRTDPNWQSEQQDIARRNDALGICDSSNPVKDPSCQVYVNADNKQVSLSGSASLQDQSGGGGSCSGTTCSPSNGSWVLRCTCPNGPSATVNGSPVCEQNCQQIFSSASVYAGNGVCEQIDLCAAGTTVSTCGNPTDPRGSGGKSGLLGFIVDPDCNGQVTTQQNGGGGEPTPPPPPPGSSFQCQQVKVFRNNVEITTADILLGDTIVFRGFVGAVNTTVSKLRFTLTKGGVPQPPVDVNAVFTGGLYQADHSVNIDTAASYSVTAAPISP